MAGHAPMTRSSVPPSFDQYPRLVQRLLGVPVSLVTLVDEERQSFLGMAGLGEPFCTTRETPLNMSICKHVVHDAAPVVISDTSEDPRLATNPLISSLPIGAYAGWPLQDGGGDVVGALCAIDVAARDWTRDDLSVLEDLATGCSAELRVLTAQKNDSEHLALTIVNSVDVALAFYNLDNRLLLANDGALRLARLAGFRLDEPPYGGPHVRRADNVEVVPLVEQVVVRALAGERGRRQLEWMGRPGDEVAVEASTQTVERADGSRWGTLIVFHDVTRPALELRTKDDFIATTSHELRTPLTSILGYVELLAEANTPVDDFTVSALEVVKRNAEHLRERIGQLLQTAQGAGERGTVVRVDLSVLAARVVATLGEPARRLGVDVQVAAGSHAWADVDADRMEQVVENLVANAVKYSEGGSLVLVTVRQQDGSVLLTVADEGVGMSAQEIEQAFDAYWRAPAAWHGTAGGNGIGLSLVERIVSAHAGEIDVMSEPGRGTTIEVRLPGAPRVS